LESPGRLRELAHRHDLQLGLARVAAVFPGALRPARALDFGCGAARLVIPLAKRFEEVVGIDISPSTMSSSPR